MARASPVKRVRRPLTPIETILLVEGECISALSPQQIEVSRVGHKAFGLSALPTVWTMPFFVVSSRTAPNTTTLSSALSRTGMARDVKLLVRSSGVDESIDQRGGLQSKECTIANLGSTIKTLEELAPAEQVVHWVVQSQLACEAKGHLSNERRIAKDKRDWIAELEAAPLHPAELHPISIRTWRDNRPPVVEKIKCRHREAIVDCISNVARWAYERLIRVHFEWVWDGHALYLVQADPCDTPQRGRDPRILAKETNSDEISVAHLEVFRRATEDDFEKYRKLSNAATYKQLGYKIVPFFVLDDSAEIKLIIDSGSCSDAVKRDLQKLTSRALVIRTDGVETPKHLREMLPRSDELRGALSAEQWLVGDFRTKVLRRLADDKCLAETNLCLLAHHFVPAVASAWCQAFPDQRRVRIESLWWIPEGLYWYAYDVHDVDTQTITNVDMLRRPLSMPVREKCRHKERFIAPDEKGAWVVHRTATNADWIRSITKAEWIQEIAWTSRCIAVSEGRPVVVMWLIDTSPQSTNHRVLPWYHQEWNHSGPIHKAAPRKKLAATSDVVVTTRIEWTNLSDEIAAGKQIARIRIDPRDPEMVRDQQFVGELADTAKRKKIVIELNGGILSHAYYMLSRAGCDVECVDLDSFATDEEAIEYNKLVRDGIPATILARGESVALMRVKGAAFIAALKRKLVEEALEVLDARSNQQIAEELADVREVCFALMSELGIEENVVESARRDKYKKRGGFADGTMLGRTSVSAPLGTINDGDFALGDQQLITKTFTRAIELPSTVVEELHVDMRHSDTGVLERQLTTVIPAHSEGFKPPKVTFDMKTQEGHHHELLVETKFERHGSNIRLRVRLINAQLQLGFDMPIPGS